MKKPMTKKRFILDSLVFDFILDNGIEISKLTDIGEYFTTNVQHSELKNIPDKIKRNKLLKIYFDLPQTKINLESGVWSDVLYWDDDQPWRDEIGQTARELVGNSKKWRDALIGEIAKINNLILVTDDGRFINKARSTEISIMQLDEFDKQLTQTPE